MKVIQHALDMNTPYYIPCSLPFINENLRLGGYESRLSVILASRVIGLPYFVKNLSDNRIKIRFFGPHLLGYKHYTEYMDLRFHYNQFKTFAEGEKYLEELMEANRLGITFGSPYHLPYSVHYHSENFSEVYGRELNIYDHAIGVCGIDDNEVMVIDTTPENRCEKIPITDFELFWRGNKYIKGFEELARQNRFMEFGYLDIEIGKPLKSPEVDHLIERGLKSTSCEYLEGTELIEENTRYSFGYTAMDRFIEDMESIKDFTDDAFISGRMRMLFEMRFTRYFYRDILMDMVQNSGKSELYQAIYNDFEGIVTELERVGFDFTVKARAKKIAESDIKAIVKKLTEIKEKEEIFHKAMVSRLSHLECLEKVIK